MKKKKIKTTLNQKNATSSKASSTDSHVFSVVLSCIAGKSICGTAAT